MALGAIGLLTAIACGDDDGSGPTFSIAVTASPTSLALDPGGTGTVTVTLVRNGGFTDPVNVTVEGLPTGVTATVQPAQLTGATTQATVTVTVANSVAPGTYPATVRASATGVGASTTQYTLTVNALPTYTLSLTPAALTIAPGANGQTTVNVTRANFTGGVTLSLDAPPAGVTATFNPSPATATTSTATINVANTVANGNYNLTIKGVATGQADKTTTLALTVAAAPNFTITANPATVTAAPGGSGNTTITIARSNLTADVALSLVTPPAGITGTFNPATLTGATLTSALTLNVGAAVAAGSYNVTVQGVGGGLTKSTTVAVTVSAAGGNLVWDFCNTDPLPVGFWRLSGGTWAAVPPTTVGNVTRYTFTIAQGSGGVAFTTNVTAAARERLYNRLERGNWVKAVQTARKAQASIKEAALDPPYPETITFYAQSNELGGIVETCPTAPATVAKTFNVTGQGANEAGLLGYGGKTTSLTSGTTAYNLNVVAGSYDWLAIFGPPPSLPDLSQNWTHYLIGRNEAAPGPAVAINRAQGTAFAQFPFTVTGGAGNSFYQFSQFFETARGDVLGWAIGSVLNSTGTGTALFLATADRQATDMNSLTISNTEPVGANGASLRFAVLYFGSAPPAGSSFALPQAVPSFTVTAQAGAPYPSWTVAGSTPTDYQTTTSTVGAAITGANAVHIVTATRAWQLAQTPAQTANYSLATPILPAPFVAAWAANAPLEDATVIMIGGNFTTAPVAGSRLNTAFRVQSPP